MKKILKWLNQIVSILLIVLLISMVFIIIASRSAGGEPSLFGYQLKAVLSGSMEPELKTGSIILVQQTEDTTNFAKNDVITFRTNENILITHRVIEMENNGEQYLTQGDANNAPDVEPVMAQNVVGKYSGFTVPYVGYALQFMNTKQGAVLLLMIPGLLFLGHAFFTIWRALKSIETVKKPSLEE
ncbi:signal peptidase I SipW [Bacillus sp. SD088]|uniref:signal peptidase I SipW n=1 Tax=Bacillus sp. SD088 TaxID=2782012 RepID=UPI001A97A143|nr:signal peptidase I [Bacillus sp. SD088]MBO0991630.1 signal peptidase I [Bacillus sp. SD088]